MRTLLLLVCVLLVAGCGSSGSATRIGGAYYPATDAEQVQVFFSEESVGREFDVIGRVTAQITSGTTFTNVSEDSVIRRLRREAASIGAEAIVVASLEDGSVPWAVQGAGGSSSLNRKTAVAAAIRFRSSE